MERFQKTMHTSGHSSDFTSDQAHTWSSVILSGLRDPVKKSPPLGKGRFTRSENYILKDQLDLQIIQAHSGWISPNPFQDTWRKVATGVDKRWRCGGRVTRISHQWAVTRPPNIFITPALYRTTLSSSGANSAYSLLQWCFN
jgi:hypothetical protein